MGSLSRERRDDTFALPSSAIRSSPSSSSFSSTSSLHSSSSSSCSSKYIEHQVSKFDTLAGVAIKYGVEIADIKKINGLTTDLQMFAHKILLIPLPGRHPPSTPIESNCSFDDRGDSATNSPRRDVLLESLRSVKLDFIQNSGISPAMSSLQSYYDLLDHKNRSTTKSSEMTVYETRGASYFEDEMLPKASTVSETQTRRSMGILRSCYHSDNSYYGKSLLLHKSGDASNGEKSKLDESVKRRQKADTDALSAPEVVEGFINRIERGLAPKALLTSLMDHRSLTQDTSQTNSLLAMMKSFSFLSLPEENDSIWSYSRWTLKLDSITKPIFSSLPKQISAWRSKAALD